MLEKCDGKISAPPAYKNFVAAALVLSDAAAVSLGCLVDRRPKRDPGRFLKAIDSASNLYRGTGPDRRKTGSPLSHISKDYRWLPRSERGLDLGADPQP